MYRFLLTPRWWGINLFVVLGVPFCLFMGSWQLGRFETRVESHQEAKRDQDIHASQKAQPLERLLPVTKVTWGRPATATGRYEDDQLLVPDRRLDEKSGFYVLTLLRTDAGKALPVVRGWLPGDADNASDRARVPAPPRGEVTVTGALQASENQGTGGVHANGGLSEGQVGMISAASLVNLVPYPVHNAWITLPEGETPGGLRAVPAAAVEGSGLDLKAFQNLGYTGEWFVFAGFVLFMWFRLVRREVESQRDLALGLLPEQAESSASPGEQQADPSPESAASAQQGAERGAERDAEQGAERGAGQAREQTEPSQEQAESTAARP
ncbi:SURF1 family protein [Streptomyces sp. NPDC047108]|uniref:SURF1 family protein n=1 Tax=Streptomyces sp. NPDC047108 TaxID=3155025 RepID=UPI0033C26541